MREVIEEILQEKFLFDMGSLKFSEERIELHILPGERTEGRFRICGRGEKKTEGFIYTSDSRMVCETDSFSEDDTEIEYVFYGDGMEEGDVLKGDFEIISNHGEYLLPFCVFVQREPLYSSLGEIKNFFHFMNLAKTSWMEAVRLFYSPSFEQLIKDSDKTKIGLYRGLSVHPYNERNVEEFLLGIRKKNPVRYVIDETEINIATSALSFRQELLITRNGWGYTNLKVETKGSFLIPEKDMLSDDDFLGNRCNFFYRIDEEMLHAGNNRGVFRFYNGDFEINVVVRINREGYIREVLIKHLEKERLTRDIMRLYLKYHLGKMEQSDWAVQTGNMVEQLQEMEEGAPMPQLLRVQLLMLTERNNEAGWLLEHARISILQSKDEDDPVTFCFYLYLSTLRNTESAYVERVVNDIKSTYEKNPGNWKIGWLLSRLAPMKERPLEYRWDFLREIYMRGCMSPIIFMEAFLLVKKNPALFTEWGEFEKQVLLFAAKEEVLTVDIIRQLHYIVPRVKEYSEQLFLILKKSYEEDSDTETLSDICTLLIKGNKTDKEAFEWYALGVEKNLRITRLYEYYMYAVNTEENMALPKVLYLYFQYQNPLNDRLSAFLYANLLKNRELYPELCDSYQSQIQTFVFDMLQKGMISKNLVFLYGEILSLPMINDTIREHLSKFIFCHEVTVQNEALTQVIVCNNYICKEQAYPIKNKKAIFPLYGTDNSILFEDGEGNRYEDTMDYEIEPLRFPDRILQEIKKTNLTNPGLLLAVCSEKAPDMEFMAQNYRRYKRLIESEAFSIEYRRSLLLPLAEYYYDADKIEELDALLEWVPVSLVDEGERGRIVKYLVLRDMTDKALEWVGLFGAEEMEPKTLLRLMNKLFVRDGIKKDPVRLDMCMYAFSKGKCDSNSLYYLMEYKEGSTKILRDVWKSARERGLETLALCEKLLIRMLYSGCFVGECGEIFEEYERRGTDTEIQRAFILQSCYDFFVKDRIIRCSYLDSLEKILRAGEKLYFVEKLAYVKFYAENRKAITMERKQIIGEILKELCRERMVFAFFREYSEMFDFMADYRDRTIFEYRTAPGKKVTLCYYLEEASEDLLFVELKNMYEGIYVGSFLLFYGEELFYYVKEEDKITSDITESGSLVRTEISVDVSENRFGMLNLIMTSEALKDYGTADSLLEEYEKKDFFRRNLLHLL